MVLFHCSNIGSLHAITSLRDLQIPCYLGALSTVAEDQQRMILARKAQDRFSKGQPSQAGMKRS